MPVPWVVSGNVWDIFVPHKVHPLVKVEINMNHPNIIYKNRQKPPGALKDLTNALTLLQDFRVTDPAQVAWPGAEAPRSFEARRIRGSP